VSSDIALSIRRDGESAKQNASFSREIVQVYSSDYHLRVTAAILIFVLLIVRVRLRRASRSVQLHSNRHRFLRYHCSCQSLAMPSAIKPPPF